MKKALKNLGYTGIVLVTVVGFFAITIIINFFFGSIFNREVGFSSWIYISVSILALILSFLDAFTHFEKRSIEKKIKIKGIGRQEINKNKLLKNNKRQTSILVSKLILFSLLLIVTFVEKLFEFNGAKNESFVLNVACLSFLVACDRIVSVIEKLTKSKDHLKVDEIETSENNTDN